MQRFGHYTFRQLGGLRAPSWRPGARRRGGGEDPWLCGPGFCRVCLVEEYMTTYAAVSRVSSRALAHVRCRTQSGLELAASSLPRHSEPAHRHEKGGARYCDRWQQLVSLAVRGVVVWFRRRRKHLASPPARLARVRPEHASRSPRLRPERWIPLRQLLRRSRLDPANLRKVTEHFEFRGGLPPRNPACRFRQRCDDTPPT